MAVYKQVRDSIDSANWRLSDVGTFCERPLDTFRSVIDTSFASVQNLHIRASNCTLTKLYSPLLGDYRRSKSYSSLAPSQAMAIGDRRSISHGLSEHRTYSPKQEEWMLTRDKNIKSSSLKRTPTHLESPRQYHPLPSRNHRRYYRPVDNCRHENYRDYWQGRWNGVVMGQAFLYNCYDLDDDRRMHRLYWGAVSLTPKSTLLHHVNEGYFAYSPRRLLMVY